MLYKLGKHKLICGDCRESKVISQLLQNEKVNLCVTSPPYNIGFNARLKQIKKRSSGGMYKHNKKFLLKAANAYEDDMPEDVYQQEQINVINNIYDVLDENGSFFYNHKIRYKSK